MKFEYFTQIIYSVSQLAAIIICLSELRSRNKIIIQYILFILSFSFIQSAIILFIRNRAFIQFNIASYLLIEYFIQSTIIEKLLANDRIKLISKTIKLSYICFISFLLIYDFDLYQKKLWISYLPIFFIITPGTLAIREIIKKKDIVLLVSFDFWVVYSFIFIQLCSFPIEIINFLFLGDNFFGGTLLKFEAHHLTYLFYHIIIIYAIKWTREK